MTTKRKPTLKQLLIAWKKYQRKSDEARTLRNKVDDMASRIPYCSELIQDGNYLYRVNAKGRYGSYEITKIASTEELNNIK
jgi:hypothetical protein